MIYGSVCSGIEAATAAWHPLGWKPAFFSEIEKFPRAVLSHHYPEVPLHGDFTTIEAGQYAAIDLLVGGTPCQAFSVAGLRKGLDDSRGNLTLEFGRLAERLDPRWIVWENVPGVLSSNRGRDFGCFLGMLSELGFGYAYRTLDAKFFGVPQNRRRIILVGYRGDFRRAAAALFERESFTRYYSAAGDKEQIAGNEGIDSGRASNHVTWWNGRGISQTLDAVLYKKQALPEKNRFPAVIVPAWQPCVDCDEFLCNIHGVHVHDCDCPGIDVWSHHKVMPYENCVLRYITPEEAEALQGFEKGYTKINKGSDTQRFKAIGNSMAVPVMKWIGKRIQMVESI